MDMDDFFVRTRVEPTQFAYNRKKNLKDSSNK